ncbi:inactive ubiquitin carboxyl-terminal hydrolase 53-like [Sinocyclocheilus grahami]|uniref:inactive ubiquitin carboxyl-terminal hydrolase 53-like n=1 Tax=Sinocyclocheilus grahami TaxID=75366 RepID=UPI0007AD508F|nr:PREDICTED: inactive ubiquitin carboxyl-terminal hydrolase 53-like [Sinocyclocheilus grahami]
MAWAKFFRRPGGNLSRSYQPGSMLSLAPTKGLLNEPGQNSCFLNSAVQVLWHLDIFRRSLRQIPNHYCLGDSCIFCALKGIFCQFQHSRERALPSDNLRNALAETFKDEQRFQLGFMDDAAECFLFYRVTDERAKKSELLLVGMICYSSRHYCAFAYHTKSSKWVFFDDANVKEVGSRWKDVVTKCIRGHFQPLLLFYSNPDGSAVVTDEAQRTNSSATQNKSSVNGEAPGRNQFQCSYIVGSRWKDVVTKCIRGHFQPLLLFYSNPDGSAVVTDEAQRTNSSATQNKSSVNGEAPGTPILGGKKLELTRENLTAFFSNHGTPKQKSQPPSVFSRGSNQTSGGRGPVKMNVDPIQIRFREILRELPKEGRPINLIKKDSDRSQTRTEKLRLRDSPDKPHSRSLSPPENGFKHLESRLYSSQGRGPTKADRWPVTNTQYSHEPRSQSQPRVPLHPPGESRSRRLDVANGYDTDSSQDSRMYGNPHSRPNRAWRPMREALNVDSIINSDNNQNSHNSRRQTFNQDSEESAWVRREERKPKSLMTIYEDEQRQDMGSRSSLESEDRVKSSVSNLTIQTDNWKFQRTESGYESSDRLSSSSANLDSPVVENLSNKDMQSIPEANLSREPNYQRRYEDSTAEIPPSSIIYSKCPQMLRR